MRLEGTAVVWCHPEACVTVCVVCVSCVCACVWQRVASATKALEVAQRDRVTVWKAEAAVMQEQIRGLEATRAVIREEIRDLRERFKAAEATMREGRGDAAELGLDAAQFWTSIAKLESQEAET